MEECIIPVIIAVLLAFFCYLVAYVIGYYLLINEVEAKHSADLINWREKRLARIR